MPAHSREHANATPDERERESLKDETRTAIEEARMVLPGIQALFWASRRLINLTSNFLSGGMGMLMLGLALEISLVTYAILRAVLPAILMSLLLLALFLWFWFLFPARNRIGQGDAPSRGRP
jgi:hypothetical protein